MRVTPREANKRLEDPALRKRLREAITDTYNAVAPDVWHGRTPPAVDFVDIISENLRWFGAEGSDPACSDEDVDVFWSLSAAARRRLCLEVGP